MTLLLGEGAPSVLGTHTLIGGSSVLLLFICDFGFGCGCCGSVNVGNLDRLCNSANVGCNSAAIVAVVTVDGDSS